MPVVFNCPPDNFDPTSQKGFPANLNVAGIYVYGVKFPIENFGELFMPIYVGIGKNIRNRLLRHYQQLSTIGNGNNSIFNFSNINKLKDVKLLYNDIKLFNNNGLYGAPSINGIESLIWYNHPAYFDRKLNLPKSTSTYKENSGHLSSVAAGGDLDKIFNVYKRPEALNLKHAIIGTKSIFSSCFYYIYSSLSDIIGDLRNDVDGTILDDEKRTFVEPVYFSWYLLFGYEPTVNGVKFNVGESILKQVEYSTKMALNKIHIYTMSWAEKPLAHIDIDLSSIHKKLVNLTGEPFNSPLVISV